MGYSIDRGIASNLSERSSLKLRKRIIRNVSVSQHNLNRRKFLILTVKRIKWQFLTTFDPWRPLALHSERGYFTTSCERVTP